MVHNYKILKCSQHSGRDPHIFYGDVKTLTVGASAAAAASSGPGGGGGWNANSHVNGLSQQLSPPLPPPSGYHALSPTQPPLPTYGTTTGVRSGREFPNSVFDKL